MTPHELAEWRSRRDCPHRENVSGLRGDCLICQCELINETGSERDALAAENRAMRRKEGDAALHGNHHRRGGEGD